MITWLDGLAEVEYRLSGGGGELVQTGAVVGVVRNGAELLAETSIGSEERFFLAWPLRDLLAAGEGPAARGRC